MCRDKRGVDLKQSPFQGLRKPKLSEEMVPEKKTSSPCEMGKGATDGGDSQLSGKELEVDGSVGSGDLRSTPWANG